MKKKLSIVVPCYNEEESIPIFYAEVKKVEKKMSYLNFEYVFVDDGSSDKTLIILKELAKKNKNVRYVSFSRNFGQEAAMLAGLTYSTGDYVSVMDADLQDPPSLIETMYKGVSEEGYDCVGAKRVNRKGEPLIRNFFTKMFYKIINKISKVKMVEGARDYGFMTREVVDSILSLKEYNRYSKGIFNFVGYKVKWIEFENVERVAGTTKWSFWKLLTYAFEAIISFSTTPLMLATILGILFFIISFIILVIIIVKSMIFNNSISGWEGLSCIIFFVSGIQLFCLGIIGSYLSRTYLETKNRPIYIVKETEKG